MEQLEKRVLQLLHSIDVSRHTHVAHLFSCSFTSSYVHASPHPFSPPSLCVTSGYRYQRWVCCKSNLVAMGLALHWRECCSTLLKLPQAVSNDPGAPSCPARMFGASCVLSAELMLEQWSGSCMMRSLVSKDLLPTCSRPFPPPLFASLRPTM